MPIDIKRN